MDTLILVDDYLPESGFTLVQQIDQQPGGATAISAVAAARLGANVSLVSRVGQDDLGDDLLTALTAEGIDTSRIHRLPERPTDETIVLISRSTGQRTIFLKQGARPSLGATLDIDSLFSDSICLVDVDDLSLFRFLVDLPVHTHPTARLLGTMTYLAEHPGKATDEILQRLDAVVGSDRDIVALTGTSTLNAALWKIQHLMCGSNLRFAAIITGANGAYGVSPDQLWHVEPHHVETLDTTGAGDAFTGALAYALALRWNPTETLQLCSIVAGILTGHLGAQTGLPTMAGVREVLENRPPAVTEVKLPLKR